MDDKKRDKEIKMGLTRFEELLRELTSESYEDLREAYLRNGVIKDDESDME